MKSILKKLFKRLFMTLLLLVIFLACIAIFITQPVFVEYGNKKAISSPDNLKKHVIMLSEKLPERSEDTDKLNKSADYIYSEFLKLSTNVNFQEYEVWGIPYKNIVVEFPSSNNTNCGTYIIGAHYDAYDGLPGADDNASGVSGLIELAGLFSKSDLPCNLILIAYTLEEPPYFRSNDMGSYIHAKSMKEKGIDIEVMISLEMIGYFSDLPNSQDYPVKGMQYLYSDKGDFISIVANTEQVDLTRYFKKEMRKSAKLPVYSINAPAIIAGIDFSDHLNYWSFGYPAIMITDTAFSRNKNYHTIDDTAEKLDYKRMGMVVDGVYYSTIAHMKNN